MSRSVGTSCSRVSSQRRRQPAQAIVGEHAVVLPRVRRLEQHQAPAAEIEAARRARLPEQRVAVHRLAGEQTVVVVIAEEGVVRHPEAGEGARRRFELIARPTSAMSPLITARSTPCALISEIASSFMKRQ